MDIFGFMYEKYKLPETVKLFEAFSGIGCQRMAFDRLGIKYEMVGFSEIDRYAIQAYNAIHGDTKNYGSICDINGADLPEIDVFTYSFPCTDLSKAGKQKGLGDTRSGLVYEVLRILQQLNNLNRLPKVLIMENVVDLVQTKFIRQFQEIQLELEQLGYTNYTQTLNAKNYGVAQNRDRVFMVSILGEYSYEFPKPIPLIKRLKDYLENDVDEKYYLSQKMFDYVMKPGTANYKTKPIIDRQIATTINATITHMHRAGIDNYISETRKDYDNRCNNKQSIICDYRYDEGIRTRSEDNIVPTLPSSHLGTSSISGQPFIVENDLVETLKNKEISNAIRTGGRGSTDRHQWDLVIEDKKDIIKPKLKIRKLTPLECWRLMDIDDELFYKAQDSGISNAQLYKMAGNGIVIAVFAAIINKLR